MLPFDVELDASGLLRRTWCFASQVLFEVNPKKIFLNILAYIVRLPNNIYMNKNNLKAITKKEQSFHQMNDIVMQIAKIYIRQHNKMQDFSVGSRLCRAEIHTVQAIGNNNDINLTELAESLKVSKPTISERIKKLIKLKLVKKQLKDGNDKEIMLSLTKQGWVAYQNHEKQHKEIYKLFKKHFGNESNDFLDSFSNELCLFLEFINDIRKNTSYYQ